MIFNIKRINKIEKLQKLNWVDKCDFILDNHRKYHQIYMIFDYEPTMFFCHYYLLDHLNEMGFKNIPIHTNVKGKIVMFTLGDTLIWSCWTNKKLKLDTDRKTIPIHFTCSDFSLAFICMLQENEARKEKHRRIKNIYKEFKNKINKTHHIKIKR